VKIAIALESPIGDFNLLRYIHRSVILITSPDGANVVFTDTVIIGSHDPV